MISKSRYEAVRGTATEYVVCLAKEEEGNGKKVDERRRLIKILKHCLKVALYCVLLDLFCCIMMYNFC